MSPRPTILLGPPGTGKTTTLLKAVAAELKSGTKPDRIGFVTFTRRAAEEATGRACEQFGLSRKELPYFRTLHSMCFRQLGLSRGDVLDGDRVRRDFASYAGVEITGRWTDDGTFSGYAEGDRILFMENLARVRGTSLRAQFDADNDGQRWRRIEQVSGALKAFKSEQGVLDYTDMLVRFAAEGLAPSLDVLFVDEAQDQSKLQWDVVNSLAHNARRLVIAGDDDQAIYRWAGADVEYLIQLEGDASVLGQSYRCPKVIQQLAEGVIGEVASRRAKKWAPRKGAGFVGRLASFRDTDLEGEWNEGVQPVLVLARNEYVLREIVEPELRSRGIIYEHAGRTSVKASTLEAVDAWEDLRAGREVPVTSALRAYGLMTSGRGVARGHKELPAFPDRGEGAMPVKITDLQKRGGLLTTAIWHDALDRMAPEEVSYILAARRLGEKLRARPRVRLSTIHGAKGGEARHVVLFKEMARRTFREMEINPDDERRVWYVAVTRAREKLTLVEGSTSQECPWL